MTKKVNQIAIRFFFVLLLLSGCVIFFQTMSAQEPPLPPPDLKGEWATLEKGGFNNWKNIKYIGGGEVADGGSENYRFILEDGTEFSVLVANFNYWTEEDKAIMRQVIYVTRDKRFYLLKPGSDEEKLLIKMVKEAKIDEKLDAKMIREFLEKLWKIIETRKKEEWVDD